mmetsp:Transcript_29909/g.36422  ORF Transcript_29909/g.36422 Transcript_29909/m.36422 type:complete len:80 (-) Transcript_29909:410-649(-)
MLSFVCEFDAASAEPRKDCFLVPAFVLTPSIKEKSSTGISPTESLEYEFFMEGFMLSDDGMFSIFCLGDLLKVCMVDPP